MIVIVPSFHACSSKQRWYSTAQYHLLYIRANGKGGPGPVCSYRLNGTVPSSPHSRSELTMVVQYHPRKGGPASSSKLDGTTLPSSPHSRSKPTPTSPRIQLTAVSRLCPLLPFSRFSSLRCSLLPPFFSLLPPFSRTPQNTSTPKKGLQRR